jgi:Ca-activated chloride channel family protein
MELLANLVQFHFLRPWWLLLLIPAALLIWSIFRRSDSLRAWKKVIEPQLLDHLTMRETEQHGRWKPVYMMGVAWLVAILALAGPSWQRQPAPFSEDLAAMFIVVKVTPEMQAQDIQPSRLQRGILKINDLLGITRDIRAGLVAYAGSAHLVMPLTSDAGVINSFAAALQPSIMPRQGDEPAEAIALAASRLKDASVPGSIVLITDAVDGSQLTALKQIHDEYGIDVHILAMAAPADVVPPPGSYPAPALDMASLEAAARAMGGTVIAVSADKRDVERLASRVERSLSNVPAQEGEQWKDAGYFLLMLLAMIMLSFFRRGGSVASA